MNINGRLLLLVVAIGLFVRVWKTNEHPRIRPVERSRSQAAERVLPPMMTSAETARSATPVSNRALTVDRRSLDENWSRDWCPIPLPAGLTAGSYRVVNDMGRVARLTIAPEGAPRLEPSATNAGPELLTIVVGTERWYLIRLRDDSATASTGEPATVSSHESLPITPEFAPEHDLPTAHRKFDFTGFVPAPDEALERLDQAARPNPPEMPSPL